MLLQAHYVSVTIYFSVKQMPCKSNYLPNGIHISSPNIFEVMVLVSTKLVPLPFLATENLKLNNVPWLATI